VVGIINLIFTLTPEVVVQEEQVVMVEVEVLEAVEPQVLELMQQVLLV
jgi:hypothetical protein